MDPTNRIIRIDSAHTQNRISTLPPSRDDREVILNFPISADLSASKFESYESKSPGQMYLDKVADCWYGGQYREAGKRALSGSLAMLCEGIGALTSLTGMLALHIISRPPVAFGLTFLASVHGAQEAGVSGALTGFFGTMPTLWSAALSVCGLGTALMYGANRYYHFLRQEFDDTRLPWRDAFEENPLYNHYQFYPGMQSSAEFIASLRKTISTAGNSIKSFITQ